MKRFFLWLFSALAFSISLSFSPDTENVNWLTFEEAVKQTRKKPKPIIIDVYTQWCGPCKMMSKNTFNHPIISKYINENFYPVKFDAETYDTVKLTVMVPDTARREGKTISIGEKPQTYTFVNPFPKGTPRSSHQFASSILDGKLAYPSIVFLNPKIQRLEIKLGYHTAEQFEPILNYYGSGSYEKMSYNDFYGNFQSKIKN